MLCAASCPQPSSSLSCLHAGVRVLSSFAGTLVARSLLLVSPAFFRLLFLFVFFFNFCRRIFFSGLSKVERKDLESEVGITAAIPQLKIMKQIKKFFPEGI